MLNVHLHAPVLDGCVDEGGRFHPLPDLDALDVAEVLATIVAGVGRLLARRGLADDDERGGSADAWLDTEPALAGMAAASVEGRVALGPRAGRRIRRRGDPSEEAESAGPGPCRARQHGFDLHAAVRIRAGCRDRLERVIRYALRPPIAADRLRLTPEGQVLLVLKRRWADGTTHLVFDPTELLERLAAITPRPRINLILYYGVLGARSAWRARVVPTPQVGDASEALEDARTPSSYLWAHLMRRSFDFDVLACARCGGRMRLVALIDQPPVSISGFRPRSPSRGQHATRRCWIPATRPSPSLRSTSVRDQGHPRSLQPACARLFPSPHSVLLDTPAAGAIIRA